MSTFPLIKGFALKIAVRQYIFGLNNHLKIVKKSFKSDGKSDGKNDGRF